MLRKQRNNILTGNHRYEKQVKLHSSEKYCKNTQFSLHYFFLTFLLEIHLFRLFDMLVIIITEIEEQERKPCKRKKIRNNIFGALFFIYQLNENISNFIYHYEVSRFHDYIASSVMKSTDAHTKKL